MLGFDFETTGIDRFNDVPVSYALVSMVAGEVVSTSAGLIDPGREIPEGASQVHGISTERARQEGVPLADGTIALIGPGTGLGQAMLIRGPAGYRVVASEGGHATLAARTEAEWGLVRYLGEKYGSHVSYERAVSGPGLVNIYHYVVERGVAATSAAVAAEMETETPAAVITRHAIDGTDAACVAAADLFVALFGSQAGNFALTALATGGVYLAGGVSRRVLPLLQHGAFLRHFADKGRFATLLAAVPVYVIVTDNVGLLGAAAVAAMDLGIV